MGATKMKFYQLLISSTAAWFCDESWILYEGAKYGDTENKCLKYFPEAKLKPDGKKDCLADDAILLVIRNRNQMKFIKEIGTRSEKRLSGRRCYSSCHPKSKSNEIYQGNRNQIGKKTVWQTVLFFLSSEIEIK